MKTFKSSIDEVAEPLSKGEKNFKAVHVVINNKKLVPGITDQDHVFNGLDRKMDQPTASYEIYKDEDESKENYDKGLKVKEEPYAEEVEMDEATLSAKAARAGKDIGKPGKNFAKIAASAAKRYSSKEAGKKVAGAILAKMRKEEVEMVDEKTLTSAEMKKREEVAKAISRENPKMPMAKKMAIATATAKKVAEDVDYDYEGEMAKTELRAICAKADALANMMSDDQQLEAWLQSKISKAKDQIDSVYDYMMYRDKPDAVVAPSQSSSMADTYGSFLNRMGEETEHVDEAMGTIKSQKAAAKFNQSNIAKMDREEKTRKASLSPKQKKIAAIAGDPDKIDAEDLSKLRSMKKEDTDLEIKSIAFNKAMQALDALKGK